MRHDRRHGGVPQGQEDGRRWGGALQGATPLTFLQLKTIANSCQLGAATVADIAKAASVAPVPSMEE